MNFLKNLEHSTLKLGSVLDLIETFRDAVGFEDSGAVRFSTGSIAGILRRCENLDWMMF